MKKWITSLSIVTAALLFVFLVIPFTIGGVQEEQKAIRVNATENFVDTVFYRIEMFYKLLLPQKALATTIPDYLTDGTDDNIQIQQAIDALPDGKGKVILSEGTFNLSASIIIDHDLGGIIEGMGERSTIIDTGTFYAFTIGSSGNFTYGQIIRNLQLYDGTGGIDIVNGDHITLENLSSNYVATVIRLRNSASETETNAIIIRNSMFGNFSAYGIYAPNPAHSLLIEHNTISALDYVATGIGIYISNGFGNDIRDNVFEGNNYSIYLTGASTTTIDNNEFVYTQTTGAIYLGGSNNVVTSNRFAYTMPVSIIMPPSATSNIIKYNNFNNGMTQSISYFGYNNYDNEFDNYSYTGIVGVLNDNDKDDIYRLLGYTSPTGDDFCYSFKSTGVTGSVFDISGNGNNLFLYNSPTWGTTPITGWGKVTFNGVNQAGKFPPTGYDNLNVYNRMSGSRTWIAVISPNFNENENANRTIFAWEVNGNNKVELLKQNNAGGDNVTFNYIGVGTSKSATAHLGFTLGNIIVLIATFNDSTGDGKLYSNGIEVASFSGGVSPNTSTAITYFGQGSGYWKGDAMLWRMLPRPVSTNEALEISNRLLSVIR